MEAISFGPDRFQLPSRPVDFPLEVGTVEFQVDSLEIKTVEFPQESLKFRTV